MEDVSNNDLDEGFDGDDDVTIAASSDALALIRETAKNLRTDDANAHVPGTRTQTEDALVNDATAVRETESDAEAERATSQRAAASARAQAGSASRPSLTSGGSLIGSAAPPDSSTTYWDPADTTFDAIGDLDDEVSMGPRKRFPKWVLFAAFVAAAVVVALAIFVAVASAQGVS